MLAPGSSCLPSVELPWLRSPGTSCAAAQWCSNSLHSPWSGRCNAAPPLPPIAHTLKPEPLMPRHERRSHVDAHQCAAAALSCRRHTWPPSPALSHSAPPPRPHHCACCGALRRSGQTSWALPGHPRARVHRGLLPGDGPQGPPQGAPACPLASGTCAPPLHAHGRAHRARACNACKWRVPMLRAYGACMSWMAWPGGGVSSGTLPREARRGPGWRLARLPARNSSQ